MFVRIQAKINNKYRSKTRDKTQPDGWQHKVCVDFNVSGIVLAEQMVPIPYENYPNIINGKSADRQVWLAAVEKIEAEAIKLFAERVAKQMRKNYF